MSSELFSDNLSWWILLLQSTVCMTLGLMGSFLFKRRAARAHQALLLGIITALLVPLLSVLVDYYDLGLLKAKPSPSKPVIPKLVENKPIVTKVIEDKLITESIITNAPLPLNDESPPSSATVIPIPQEPSAEKIETPTVTNNMIEKIPWISVLMGIWVAISLIFLLRLTRTFILGICLLRAAEPLDNDKLTETLLTACTKLGVRNNIDIRISQTVQSPIIWCWSFRPILLLPASIKNLTRHADWLSLFCHEVAHWKRLDHVVGLGTELLVSLIWWHPLVWWAKQRLLYLSEQACDDWVLASGQIGPDYAELLLNLLPEGRMAFVPTIMRKENTMKKRIQRIIKHPVSNPRVGWNWALTALLIALSIAIGTSFAQRGSVRIAQQEHLEHREEIIETIHYLESRIKATNTEIEDLERNGRGEGVKARILHNEVGQMHERLDDLVRELRALDGNKDMDRPQPEQRQLEHRAEEIHNILRELDGRNPERAEQLEKELHEIHIRLDEIGAQTRGREMDRPQPERRLLEQRAEEIHNILRELDGRNLERAEQLEKELHEIHIRLDEIGAQARGREMDRPQPERRQLEQRAEEIHNILRELEGRNPERAEQLEKELHEIHVRLDEIGAQTRGREMDRPHLERRQLEQRAEEIHNILRELDGRDPERAEQLEKELHEIHIRLDEIATQARGREMDRQQPERRLLEQRAEEIHNILHELEGRDPERAEQLEKELHEILARMEEIEARGREMDRQQPERRQLEQRAEEIHRTLRELDGRDPERIEQLEKELHEIHIRLDEIGAQSRDRERPRPEQIELEHKVQELNGQVERLNREMQEIHKLLQQLTERLQR